MRTTDDTYTADLFDPRYLARNSDPETSKAAARRVREFAAGHHALILEVLGQHPDGLTVHEVAAFCKLTAHEVGKRISELDRAEKIDPVLKADGTGTLTRPSPTGRHARVWTLKGAKQWTS